MSEREPNYYNVHLEVLLIHGFLGAGWTLSGMYPTVRHNPDPVGPWQIPEILVEFAGFEKYR